MTNALLDETRTERVDLGLPFLPQLRVSPTIHALLKRAKGDAESWPDFATRAMVVFALLPDTLGLRLRELNRLVVRIVGNEAEMESFAPDSRREPSVDLTPVRKPIQMSLKTALVEAKAGKR